MLLRVAFGHYYALIHSTSSCAVSFINNSLPRRVYVKTEKLTKQMRLKNVRVGARLKLIYSNVFISLGYMLLFFSVGL